MRRTAVRRVLTAVLALIFVLGTVTYADIEETLTYQGNKARIAIGTIKPKADKCSSGMAAAVGEMLSTSLVNTGKFIVLASQEEVAELADEIEFAQSGYVEEGRGPEKGLMEGADLLITGAVTVFEPDAGGSGGGLGGLTNKAFGKIGVQTKTAKLEMDIKLIDIRTRRILKAKTIKAETKNWKTDMAGGGWTKDVALSGGLGMYSNEPMEKAVRAALAKTVDLVSKEVPKDYYRYQGQGEYTQEYGASSQAAGTAGQPAAASGAAATPAATTPATAKPVPAAEDMTLYTKYDFVPGDRVIFFDDLSGEEEGEFPSRWNLDRGVFEIARMGGKYWILCTDQGYIRPKVPEAPFPEKYTVELEYYSNGPNVYGGEFVIFLLDAKGQACASFGVSGNGQTWLDINNQRMSDKTTSERPGKGPHWLRLMATSRSIKCYHDQERMANVPKTEGVSPVGFQIKMSPYGHDPQNPDIIRTFRFAEGGKSMREQLDETGKVVTHGILFDPGSYTIKAESYCTLKLIGRLFEDDPQLRLSIEGHTDSDGAEDSNMDLSLNRANAVRDYLIANYGVGADQLEAKGWGETKPIDTNNSAEGKANNRRVELVKL